MDVEEKLLKIFKKSIKDAKLYLSMFSSYCDIAKC
jgi:hypothetical protein